METLDFKYCDIPSYLHAGDFYRNLDSEDPEGIIEIPADCFHPDGETAADLEEFRQLLRVKVFWALDDIPVGVLKFCDKCDVQVWEKGLVDLPPAVLREIQPALKIAYSDPSNMPLDEIFKSGRWDLIKHAMSRMVQSGPATAVAAKYGNLRLLKYLHELGYMWHEDTCRYASKNGHLACLQYAHENGCPLDAKVYVHAARNGHISCMKYASEQGLEWHADVCDHAAQYGQLECLRFAHENGCSWDVKVHIYAATHGHLSCLQYAYQKSLEWHADVCRQAALNGHLKCLQFAHENGCPWDISTTASAAQEGHVECLQYALERSCTVDANASNLACAKGHLGCLQVLQHHDAGESWDECTARHAAMSSNDGCLQFLHATGCPWDEHTPSTAASKGLVEPLKYALRNGCPYSEYIVRHAALSSNLACLRNVVEDQGLYMDEEVFKFSILRGNLACVQYLLDQGCPFTSAEFSDSAEGWEECDRIFQKDNPEFVQCVVLAVERGWVLCDNFVNYIVARHEACKKWLISEGHYTEA